MVLSFARVIGIASLAIIGGAHMAAALDAARVSDAQTAANELVARAKDSHKTGAPPRVSDPAVEKLFERVFDTKAVESTVVPFSDVQKLMEWFSAGNQIGSIYILAGTNLTDTSKAGEDPEALARVEKNISTFAPELGRYYDFMVTMSGVISDTFGPWLASLKKEQLERPNVKSGAAQVRSGLLGVVNGALTSLANDEVDDAFRRDRLVKLNLVAPKLAAFLDADQLAALCGTAAEVAGSVSDPSIQASVKAFGEKLAKP
jgi:hypothetical protein